MSLVVDFGYYGVPHRESYSRSIKKFRYVCIGIIQFPRLFLQRKYWKYQIRLCRFWGIVRIDRVLTFRKSEEDHPFIHLCINDAISMWMHMYYCSYKNNVMVKLQFLRCWCSKLAARYRNLEVRTTMNKPSFLMCLCNRISLILNSVVTMGLINRLNCFELGTY